MHLEWFGLAESFTNDARGMPAIIGFNQQQWAVTQFPATIALAILMIITDLDGEEIGPGLQFHATWEVRGPDDAVLFHIDQDGTVPSGPQNPALPTRLQLFGNVPVRAEKEGIYRARSTIASASGLARYEGDAPFLVSLAATQAGTS